MCNGHRFVKSTLFQSPGYLADLSPYISAVISSRFLATPIQLTASAIRPLKPLAQSILPTRASNFILNGTLTCEYCFHQVSQESFDDGRICPSLLLERLGITSEEGEFVLADQLLEAQDRRRVRWEQERLEARLAQSNSQQNNPNDSNSSNESHHSNDMPSTSNSSGSGGQIKQPLGGSLKSNSNNIDYEKLRAKQMDEAKRYKQELLIMQICPENGLHAQGFTCLDCDKEIDLSSSRLCHYDGRYYCFNCHTGSDLAQIPARVLRSWDFTLKPVSKLSLQKICYLRTKPVLFNLFQINSMLYGFIDRLIEIKQIRERIQSMLKYLEVCGQPEKPCLITTPKHFLNGELQNFFTLNDLFDIDQVYNQLTQLQVTLESHIVGKCESCRGKGFYCELCKDPRDVLYPFSKNGATCSKCHTVYHKNCFHRKKKNCPRCVRLGAKQKSSASISETEQGSLSQDSLGFGGNSGEHSGYDSTSAIQD